MKPNFLSFAAIALMSVSASFADFVVDFGIGNTFYNAPYTEDGLTLAPLPNSAVWTIGPWNGLANDNSISTGTNGLTALRISSNVGLIDLLSFDVRGVSGLWQAQSSSGAVFAIPSGNATNTISPPSTGWTGITHFDISANGANSALRLDNIRFNTTAVPEPSSALLVSVGVLAIVTRLSLRRRRATLGITTVRGDSGDLTNRRC